MGRQLVGHVVHAGAQLQHTGGVVLGDKVEGAEGGDGDGGQAGQLQVGVGAAVVPDGAQVPVGLVVGEQHLCVEFGGGFVGQAGDAAEVGFLAHARVFPGGEVAGELRLQGDAAMVGGVAPTQVKVDAAFEGAGVVAQGQVEGEVAVGVADKVVGVLQRVEQDACGDVLADFVFEGDLPEVGAQADAAVDVVAHAQGELLRGFGLQCGGALGVGGDEVCTADALGAQAAGNAAWAHIAFGHL